MGDQPPDVPRAIVHTHEASEFATRWVFRMMWLVFAALAVLCFAGHIPSGG
jgi:hypothetical protein